jgi:hypothetical protein
MPIKIRVGERRRQPCFTFAQFAPRGIPSYNPNTRVQSKYSCETDARQNDSVFSLFLHNGATTPLRLIEVQMPHHKDSDPREKHRSTAGRVRDSHQHAYALLMTCMICSR